MKIFFFLGHTFFEQSVGIAREVKAKFPDSKFSGIVAARSNLLTDIEKIKDIKFERYDWLSGLEEKWLNIPLDAEKLKEYEAKLGTEALRRIITADRELAVGFVSCGKVERTELMGRTIHNDDARWRYVVGLLDYFFEVFEKERPDATFAYCIAGAVAFAMAEVSLYLGITFVQPIYARIGSFYVLDSTIRGMLPEIKENFQKALDKPAVVEEFLPAAKKYLEDFRNRPDVPDYSKRLLDEMMEKNSYAGMLKVLAVDIARWGAVTLGIMGSKGVLRQRSGLDILKFNLSTFWELRKTLRKKMKVFSEEKITSKYIYYALHVDPEASTMVLADMHTDQMAVIEAIAKSMPAGMKLVVKEHIPCIGRRPKGFYERIHNMPDVQLVSPFSNNFELIKNASLVCSITGTVIWEAMLLGVPAIVFGDVHFLNVEEGVVHNPDLSKLAPVIKQAMNIQAASDDTLKAYIATVMKHGVEVSSDDMWYKGFDGAEERQRGIKGMAKEIIRKSSFIS